MGVEVYINIYDLSHANKYLNYIGLGAYHTGVVIENREYSFGGHDYDDVTGVFDNEPRCVPNALFRQTVHMGSTRCSRKEVFRILDDLSAKWKGTDYEIFSRNCNTFADDLCRQILGKGVPRYVNRLPYFGSCFSCILSNEFLSGRYCPSGAGETGTSDKLFDFAKMGKYMSFQGFNPGKKKRSPLKGKSLRDRCETEYDAEEGHLIGRDRFNESF